MNLFIEISLHLLPPTNTAAESATMASHQSSSESKVVCTFQETKIQKTDITTQDAGDQNI